MTANANSEDLALAALRTEFTGHRIWRSVRSDGKLGDWVASLHDPQAGVYPTVIESDAATLRTSLIKERRRASVAPDSALEADPVPATGADGHH